jgi:hypothetical protein
MPSAPPEATNAAPAKIEKPVAVTNGPALEFEAREPLTGPTPASPPNVVISPQMLIKYFTTPPPAATNAASVGAVTPVGFTPPPVTTPAPTTPASAKAAHSTSP